MNKKKAIIFLIIIGIIFNVIILLFGNEVENSNNITLTYTINVDQDNVLEVFYSDSLDFNQELSANYNYTSNISYSNVTYKIPKTFTMLRMDFGDKISNVQLKNVSINYGNKSINLRPQWIVDNLSYSNMISDMNIVDNTLVFSTTDRDGFIVIDCSSIELYKMVMKYDNHYIKVERLVICAIIDMILILCIINLKKLLCFPLSLYANRGMIISLAKNDFHTKYTGSILGVIWGFINPIVTLLLYWFVFQIGFKTPQIGNHPYFLWLMAGLVPWFYFADAITGGTNSLIEYNYLVKKIVFQVADLPVVKILSTVIIHFFFMIMLVLSSVIYGYSLDMHVLQLIYYTFCALMLSLSIVYITSSLVLFFRDLSQMIPILIQIGMWATPIMWNATIVSSKLEFLYKYNPFYYVIRGYRDSILDKIWFTSRLGDTFFFWCITGLLLLSGVFLFNKLRPHFADVI